MVSSEQKRSSSMAHLLALCRGWSCPRGGDTIAQSGRVVRLRQRVRLMAVFYIDYLFRQVGQPSARLQASNFLGRACDPLERCAEVRKVDERQEQARNPKNVHV